jgi:hypothetical protein
MVHAVASACPGSCKAIESSRDLPYPTGPGLQAGARSPYRVSLWAGNSGFARRLGRFSGAAKSFRRSVCISFMLFGGQD